MTSSTTIVFTLDLIRNYIIDISNTVQCPILAYLPIGNVDNLKELLV